MRIDSGQLSEGAGDGDVTVILHAMVSGSRAAAADLLPAVYGELRRLAQATLRNLPPGQTLSATALVHEAYLRLVGEDGDRGPGWEGRVHFFNAAAQAMRHILVDAAKRKSRIKHGGGRSRDELHEDAAVADEPSPPVTLEQADEILAIDSAMDRLRQEHPRKGQVVMLQYFGGLTHEQIADLLQVTTRTVERDWRFARAWLREALGDSFHGTAAT
jgi:RNA polymerase sigma factor (TIGR02999 family)